MQEYKYIINFLIVACLLSWPILGLGQENESQPPKSTEGTELEDEAALPADEGSPEDVEKLNLNFASIKDLQWLTDENEELAQALADGRPYAALEEILTVDGMTEDLFIEIHDLIEIRKLNLNDATLAELLLLPGIDEPIARVIIKERPYTMVEELLRIRGISEKRLQEFREQIEAKPARRRADLRGWNIKKRRTPLKIERPLEKRPTEETDASVNVEPDDENGGE